jgi:PAS domain S-box-containing protein
LIGQTARRAAVRADGTTFPVEITITSTVGLEAGGYTAVVRDLSERDQYEEKAAILSALLDTEEAAVVAFTLQGIVTAWNPGAERLYGYTAEEACGKRVGLLVLDPADEEDARFVDIMRRVSEGASAVYDGQRRRKDGTTVGVSVTLKPLVERGEVVGMVGITRRVG